MDCKESLINMLNSGVAGYCKCLPDFNYCVYDTPLHADLVVVHTSGIYIFNTSCYKGKITSRTNSMMWLSIGKNKSTQFCSPALVNQLLLGELSRYATVRHTYIVYDDNAILEGVPDSHAVRAIRKSTACQSVLQDMQWHSSELSPASVDCLASELSRYSHSETVKARKIKSKPKSL